MAKSKKLPIISPESTLSQAMTVINDFNKGIALVVDQDRHLMGTITDGDIRRAILKNISLQENVTVVLEGKRDSPYSEPISASVDTPVSTLLTTMQESMVRQLPILDSKHRVVDLITLDDLLPKANLPLQAVIMAGGFGNRLRPLTEDMPKPMLLVGGKPLMERVLEQLRQAGIHHVNITTYYKSEKIVEYFGDGHEFGVELNYVNEDRPLGTGGALGLMPAPREPLIVMNGDILTQVNFRTMHAFHQEHKADLTVAVRRYEMQVPYGVIECEGARVRRLQEKPQVGFLVNAGIYLLEPSVYQFIPQNVSFNMTDLIQWLLDAGRNVVSFPISEYWLDIGQHADYDQAQVDIKNGLLAS